MLEPLNFCGQVKTIRIVRLLTAIFVLFMTLELTFMTKSWVH